MLTENRCNWKGIRLMKELKTQARSDVWRIILFHGVILKLRLFALKVLELNKNFSVFLHWVWKIVLRCKV